MWIFRILGARPALRNGMISGSWAMKGGRGVGVRVGREVGFCVIRKGVGVKVAGGSKGVFVGAGVVVGCGGLDWQAVIQTEIRTDTRTPDNRRDLTISIRVENTSYVAVMRGVVSGRIPFKLLGQVGFIHPRALM
jgi:hypothetical protein